MATAGDVHCAKERSFIMTGTTQNVVWPVISGCTMSATIGFVLIAKADHPLPPKRFFWRKSETVI